MVSKSDLNKSKVLLVLFLLPMALGTTSLINKMSSGSKDMFSLTDDISDILSTVNQTLGTDNARLDLDGDGTRDTSLEFSFMEETPENDPWTDRAADSKLMLKIVATSDSNVTINDGTCDCDTTQTIYLGIGDNLARLARKNCAEETSSEEEATAEEDSEGTSAGRGVASVDDEIAQCKKEFEDAILAFIRRNKNLIKSKLNDKRETQHAQNLEEKDCENKDDMEDKIECFINAAVDLPRDDEDKREEVFSRIEEYMEGLNYSDEEDKEIFSEMLDKLRDVRYSSNLRKKLRRHRDTREFVDDKRSDLGELHAKIEEAKRQLDMAEQAFNESQKTPWDFGIYQQRTQQYHNEHMYLTSQFSRQKNYLQHQSLDMIRRYQYDDEIFNQHDVDLATRYATTGYNFPHHQTSPGIVPYHDNRPGSGTRRAVRNTGGRRVNLDQILGGSSYWGIGGVVMQNNRSYNRTYDNLNPNMASPNLNNRNLNNRNLSSPGNTRPTRPRGRR